MGASWNSDAILNCKLDGYSGSWSLADYAVPFYLPLLGVFQNINLATLPYYYDWRKVVPNDTAAFTDFIDSNLASGEKIDIVGHSMGGLLGRNYLESTGDTNRLDKLLTVGSPHQGVAQVYPAWSGGDVWEDNFLLKLAMNIIIRHCATSGETRRETIRKIAPSLQNLLPTFNYLRDNVTKLLKPVSGMNVQNNWLPTASFSPPFFGAAVGTLVGTGFDTIKNIVVKPPSAKDITAGNWLDGKPTAKEKVTTGDGTVLVQSGQVIGADNTVISQTHTGLITSSDGLNAILNFFNLSSAAKPLSAFVEPKSALLVIGYPAHFWVIDPDGKTRKDSDALVAFLNPKKGTYKLRLLPKSGSTLVIVGQFLENGNVLWKEYKLKNILPKFKSVVFDPTNPIEDALK